MISEAVQSPERTLHQERLKRFEEAYRQSLFDEQGGFIEIASQSFHPADILKTLQPVAYGAGLAEFANSEIERIVDDACELLPTPVSHALYSALHGAENEIQRVLHYRDTTECLALVMLALVVGECRLKKVTLDEVEIIVGNSVHPQKLKRRHLRSDRIADRLGVVEGILRFCSSSGIDLRVADLLPVHTVARLREMNFVRNEVSHTQAPTEEEAREIASEMRAEFEEILQELSGLTQVFACRFCGVEPGRSDAARFEDLTGHARSRHVEPRTVSTDQILQCVQLKNQLRLLFLLDDMVIESAPYLHSRPPRGGNASDVLLFKSKRDQPQAVVQFEVSGSREAVELPLAEFQADFDALNSLFLGGD